MATTAAAPVKIEAAKVRITASANADHSDAVSLAEAETTLRGKCYLRVIQLATDVVPDVTEVSWLVDGKQVDGGKATAQPIMLANEVAGWEVRSSKSVNFDGDAHAVTAKVVSGGQAVEIKGEVVAPSTPDPEPVNADVELVARLNVTGPARDTIDKYLGDQSVSVNELEKALVALSNSVNGDQDLATLVAVADLAERIRRDMDAPAKVRERITKAMRGG